MSKKESDLLEAFEQEFGTAEKQRIFVSEL